LHISHTFYNSSVTGVS